MLFAACSSADADRPNAAPTGPGGASAPVDNRPNVVFVLTDDLSSNLVPFMPHVLGMERRGATFANYFVTDSLCCPSRTSILTGMYPHDSGVYANTGVTGGYEAFDSHGDTSRTFALDLQRSGYRTGMMGKYLNGYEPYMRNSTSSPFVPEGWNEWDVAGYGYNEYNYLLNENHHLVSFGNAPSDYLTDVLSRIVHRFMRRSTHSGPRRPFALEVATFAPHDPYVYAPRDANRFDNLRAPRTPAFNRLDVRTAPPWLAEQPPLSAPDISEIDRGFRDRVRAVQAVDRMIGALERELDALGLSKNTYLVFSSDNGYHMGEHRLRPGKLTAFDTDIRVPLVITGPGIRPGLRIKQLAENIDLAPTFEQLAGLTPPPTVDGRSLVPLLEGQQPADWRRAVLVEHHGPDTNVNDPDYPMTESGNPPSYEAIRLTTSLYVEYVDGEREYYDIAKDPYELHNTFSDQTARKVAKLHTDLERLVHCRGSTSCHLADQLRGPPGSGRART